MIDVKSEQLRLIMPGCSDSDRWIGPLNKAMAEFAIDNKDRAAAFLAQLAHESGQFRHLEERLDYSAERLMAVWPKRFPNFDKAHQYEHNQEKLANFVYASRLGNGDEQSGDGWRFHGRGLIQVTGRGNYRDIGVALQRPYVEQPDLLLGPVDAARSAGFFWKSHGLNSLADDQSGDDDDADFVAITVKINGGTNGLDERRAFWKRAKQAFP